MDELEEYIRSHRKEFDKYSPPASLWRNIRTATGGKYSIARLGFAAAAILIILIGIAALIKVMDNKLPGNEKYEALIKNDQLIRETEIYYNTIANEMYMKAKPLLTTHPDLEKELITDLSQLDSICTEIKKDLKDNISNQEVIEALINNYRIRIMILTDMLDQLKQEENNIPNQQKDAL